MNRRSFGVGILALALIAASVFAVVVSGCTGGGASSAPPAAQQPAAQQPANPPAAQEQTLPAGLKFPVTASKTLVIKDVTKGSGAEAVPGKQVTVNYTGWLTDGTKFDSSIGRGPFTFALGAGQVIPGWDKGVAGMKVGGTRVLIIPADQAYGAQGSPPVIPPNAPLVFVVQLVGVQ